MEEEFQKDRFSVISMSELMNEDSKEERDRKRKQILEEEAEESDEGNPLGELAAEMDQDEEEDGDGESNDDADEANRELLRGTQVEKKKKKKNALSKYPFLRFGEGILSYLKLQYQLNLIFVGLTALAMVNVFIFSSFTGFDGLNYVPWEAKYSFGNMGFATS